MKQDVNVVVITGNLTRDPELRTTQGGTSVCELRVAVNSRRKNTSGEWIDKPNFFNVTTFGSQAENHAEYLGKGRPVAVEGRLDWSEWERMCMSVTPMALCASFPPPATSQNSEAPLPTAAESSSRPSKRSRAPVMPTPARTSTSATQMGRCGS
jgi:single stranded DNA-binding protein